MSQINIRDTKSKNNVWRNTNGFTLIEVIIAMMLVSIIFLAAFPLVKTGRTIVEKKQKEIEVCILGDGMFDGLTKEMQNSAEMGFDTEELENKYSQNGIDVEITIEMVKSTWAILLLRIKEEDAVLYEREEMVHLPNAGLKPLISVDEWTEEED